MTSVTHACKYAANDRRRTSSTLLTVSCRAKPVPVSFFLTDECASFRLGIPTLAAEMVDRRWRCLPTHYIRRTAGRIGPDELIDADFRHSGTAVTASSKP